jgi:ribosomal protein S18 acetylase RimI-like enzyme
VEIRDVASGSGAVCRRILGALPTWFGVAASVEEYSEFAERFPVIVASVDGDAVGFVAVRRHSPHAAEVYAMGVLPEFHRQGIGRAMLEHAEAARSAAGVEFLQVKTLSSRREDAGYAKTRLFYEAHGFRVLEEMDLWGPENPTLMMIKAVPRSPAVE